MKDVAAAQDMALAEALLWLKNESPDEELSEAMFGTRADNSGCWWVLRFAHEVNTGEMRRSAQDDEKKHWLVIAAWRRVFIPGEEQDRD